jgi:hypothetical protein
LDKVTNSIKRNFLITRLKSFFLPFIILISVLLTQKIVAQEVVIADNSAAVQAGKKTFLTQIALRAISLIKELWAQHLRAFQQSMIKSGCTLGLRTVLLWLSRGMHKQWQFMRNITDPL